MESRWSMYENVRQGEKLTVATGTKAKSKVTNGSGGSARNCGGGSGSASGSGVPGGSRQVWKGQRANGGGGGGGSKGTSHHHHSHHSHHHKQWYYGYTCPVYDQASTPQASVQVASREGKHALRTFDFLPPPPPPPPPTPHRHRCCNLQVRVNLPLPSSVLPCEPVWLSGKAFGW